MKNGHNLEAIKLGYIFFKVNDEYFLTYDKANLYCDDINQNKDVDFIGFQILRGWESFYLRVRLSAWI